jgi:hypothetical protein
MPRAALDSRLANIRQLGATWIRVDFTWVVIQPKHTQKFEFYFHDKVVRAAQRAGLKVMGVLAYTPKWARTPQCIALAGPSPSAQQKCAPGSTREFARFAATTAKRYRGGKVQAWEVWNEPNLISGWRDVNKKGELEVNPISYARFAMHTADAIRKVDPAVAIVTGGMAPMFEAAPSRGMRQSDFLRGMLPYLTPGKITAIGMHPYTWPATPRDVADWNAFYTVDQGRPAYNLHSILTAAGRNDLRIWATEYGASTIGRTPINPDPAAHVRPDHVSEDLQAQIVREGVEDWYGKPNVGPLFMYADSDKYLPKRHNEGGFGLRHEDDSPKPAYTALRDTFRTVQSTRAAELRNSSAP